MARSPQEIFGHHGKALMDGDLDEIMVDYGPRLGLHHAGRRPAVARTRSGQVFSGLLTDLPAANWTVPRPRSSRATRC